MFIVLLRFAGREDRAREHMDGHRAWIERGFDDGVFLLVGSVQPRLGGALLAHGTSLAALEARVQEDPFVAQEVVTAEKIEIAPSRAEERLTFLLRDGSSA